MECAWREHEARELQPWWLLLDTKRVCAWLGLRKDAVMRMRVCRERRAHKIRWRLRLQGSACARTGVPQTKNILRLWPEHGGHELGTNAMSLYERKQRREGQRGKRLYLAHLGHEEGASNATEMT